MGALLEVRDLVVSYKTDDGVAQAINGISFNIEKGETLGIVGETGAGKTTTALSIMQLLPDRTAHVESGHITFEGVDLLEVSQREMETKYRGDKISMIFQDPMTALNPVMKVGAQIAEAIYYHRPDFTKEQIDKRVDETLELVGIPAFRKEEYPHQFSGGMKQRVVIAIALSCEPSLLIADEPTTALDVTIQAQVMAMIAELKKTLNMAMILITHDLGIVAQVCDRVCVMYAGEIIEAGDIFDIFEGKHHHPYTQGLFGSIPNVNFGKTRLSPIDGLMPDARHLPGGCKFHPRCPYKNAKCEQEKPQQRQITTSHFIACHLFSEEGGL